MYGRSIELPLNSLPLRGFVVKPSISTMDYESDWSYDSSSSEDEDENYDAHPAWAFEHYISEGIQAMLHNGAAPRLNEEIFCPRELTYERIAHLLKKRELPAIIQSIENSYTAFDMREAAIGPVTTDIDEVLPPKAAESWRRFWEGRLCRTHGMWSCEEWDTLGDFTLELLNCCDIPITNESIQSCMIRLLGLCHFK